MLLKTREVNPVNIASMNGPKNKIATADTRIFGIKVKVCS
jgi:hypothetical protein